MNIKRLRSFGIRWGAYLLALAAALIYFLQSWYFAHTQISVLDEGAYLVKGLLYATGRYIPFQDYGPSTNHMPLAFLIPGWVQVLFGAGIRTGRYFAIFLGLLALLGVWLLVKRVRGPWWAASALSVFAFGTPLIKIYSVAVSQVLIFCLLTWCLFFAIGPGRKTYELVVAALLAAAIWFTRINMAPVLFLLIVYIYFGYGARKAVYAGLAGFGFIALGHILYWPDVLKIWAYWLPRSISPFLDSWRLPADAVRRWNPEITWQGRFNSLLQTIQTNLVPLSGLLAGLILWSAKQWKRKPAERRAALFVAILFLGLFLLHGFVTLSSEYCVYCLQVYAAFFNVLAVVFLVLVILYWGGPRAKWVNVSTAVLIPLISVGIGYSISILISGDWLAPRIVRGLLDLHFINGVPIGVLVQNKYGLEYGEAVNLARRTILHWLPAVAGLLAGALVLLAAQRVRIKGLASKSKEYLGFAARAWVLFILVALLLSPTRLIGSGYATYDCSGDVIASYEAIGASLSRYVQPGKLVYWSGGDSAVPLLYIPDAQVFPAQINDGYTFYLSGDTGEIERYGYWDENLQTQWLDQADYLLIEGRFYDDYWVNTGDWVELAVTPPADTCREGAEIHILGRLSN